MATTRAGWAIVLAALAGCTSVKLVQRDGCWVRQTQKKPFGALQEELGPCASPETPWVQGDRLTRLVQECAARADRRWQSRALAAWSRGEPLPEQLAKDAVLQECMTESVKVVSDAEALKGENEGLRKQLSALAAERDALRARDDRERAEILQTSTRLADHLGEAAKKAQQPAVATATARSEQSSEAQAPAPAPSPGVTVVNSAPTTPPAASTAPVSAGAAGAPKKPETPVRARRPAASRPPCASPAASPSPNARSTCPDP